MSSDKNFSSTLTRRLIKLQEECALVGQVVARTNQLEYENLSSIYIWWYAACTVDGYLENVYESVTRRVNKTSHTLSFKKLLYLMYGNFGLDKDNLDRKNAVLCRLHDEYSKNTLHYSKDTVSKLAGFIKSNGGVNGLISTNKSSSQLGSNNRISAENSTSKKPQNLNKKNQNSRINTSEISARKNQVEITNTMRYKALHNDAQKYFSSQIYKHQIPLSTVIKTDKNGYAVALIKQSDDGSYEFVADFNEASTVRDLLVTAYRHQFAALPESIRCIFETIRTQMLTSNLNKIRSKLVEKSKLRHEDKTHKTVSNQLLYIAKKNELILSPVNAVSGVVTVAKLRSQIFEGDSVDVFLTKRCIRLIENRALTTNDFNIFEPSDAYKIPKYTRPNLASHLIKLQNKAEIGDFFYVDFWHFNLQENNVSEQLYYSEKYVLRCKKKCTVSQVDFRQLITDHIEKWLFTYGDNITRPASRIIKFGINANQFVIDFNYVAGSYCITQTSLLTNSIPNTIKHSAEFFTKDICVALYGLSKLQLIGDVELIFSNDALIIDCNTSSAEYRLVIPTVKQNVRSDKAIVKYSPICGDDKNVAYNTTDEVFNDDLLIEREISSKKQFSDDEIERLIQLEYDFYDDFSDGMLLSESEVNE